MQQIEAVIDPYRLQEVRDALESMGIGDYAESTVRCHQKGRPMMFRGATFMATIAEKIKLEIVAADDMVDAIIDTIASVARAGHVAECRFAIHPSLKVT